MIVVLLILLVLSGLFSSSETAFASVNKIRLKAMADQGDKRAETALRVSEHYEDALTAILVGNNIANIGSSSLATVLFTQWVGDIGPAVATVVMTILVLTFCEVLPKSYAKSHAESLALHFAAALSGFTKLMTPFVKIFDLMSKAFRPKTESPSVTEDELKYIIDEIEEEGVLEEQESDLVLSALQFDETTVNDILIPRVKIVGVSSEATIEEICGAFEQCGYSHRTRMVYGWRSGTKRRSAPREQNRTKSIGSSETRLYQYHHTKSEFPHLRSPQYQRDKHHSCKKSRRSPKTSIRIIRFQQKIYPPDLSRWHRW